MSGSQSQALPLGRPALVMLGCTLGIACAFAALVTGVAPAWSVVILVAFPASLLLARGFVRVIGAAERADIFSPVVAFPVLYVGWFALGAVDFIDLPRTVAFGLFEPIPQYVLGYAALGLLAYMAGAMLSRKTPATEQGSTVVRFAWNESRFWMAAVVMSVMMLASFAYIVARMGVIPAFTPNAGEVRLLIRNHGAQEAVLFTCAWSLVPMLMMFVWLRRPKKKLRMLCYAAVGLMALLLLSLGGRSYLFVPLLTVLVVRHYCHRRFRIAKLMPVAVGLFCALSLFGYVRDSSLNGGADVASDLSALGIPSSLAPLAYSYFYVRYTVATFRDVTTVIPQRIPYQHGTLSLGPLATVLPGHHEQSDMFFKNILGNDFIGAGQPATLLGPLYGDAGLVGIVLGLFLFGLLMSRAHAWMLDHPTALRVLLYAWLMQTLLFSLFSNLFPYITTIWIPAFWGALHLFFRTRANDHAE